MRKWRAWCSRLLARGLWARRHAGTAVYLPAQNKRVWHFYSLSSSVSFITHEAPGWDRSVLDDVSLAGTQGQCA